MIFHFCHPASPQSVYLIKTLLQNLSFCLEIFNHLLFNAVIRFTLAIGMTSAVAIDFLVFGRKE